MKDFNEFLNLLTDDFMTDIHKKALEFANKIIEENYKDNSNAIFKAVEHERYYNAQIIVFLLRKYHEWLSEQLNDK